MALTTVLDVHCLLNTFYKPDKVQNGVGPISLIVSVSTKYFEEQYSDVLSVYMIRKNIAKKREKIQMESLFTKKSLTTH